MPNTADWKARAETAMREVNKNHPPVAQTARYAEAQACAAMATLEALDEMNEQLYNLDRAIKMLADR